MKYLERLLLEGAEDLIKSLKEESKTETKDEKVISSKDSELKIVLRSDPPKYTETKLVSKHDLYVLKIISRYGNYFAIVSPKMYKKGYFPRIDLLGRYEPSEGDLFVFDIGTIGFYDLKSVDLIPGDELSLNMNKSGIYKAFYVDVK